MSAGTYAAIGSPDFDGLQRQAADGVAIELGEMRVLPFTVPHDAREPLQLRCSDGDLSLGIVTDLGHATSHVLEHLATGASFASHELRAAAIAQALRRHPYLNAEIRGNDIIFKKDIHLGMAVSIDNPEPGLMVPVIKNADQMNLRGLAHTITDLAARTRIRRIKPDEISGSTFTITNPGNYGAIIGMPIINQPNLAIFGVGRIQKEVVVKEVDGLDVLAIKPMGVVCLGFDHRLIDGHTADAFMADVKKTLETWDIAP